MDPVLELDLLEKTGKRLFLFQKLGPFDVFDFALFGQKLSIHSKLSNAKTVGKLETKSKTSNGPILKN